MSLQGPSGGEPPRSGISPRKALFGAVILVLLTSLATYAALTYAYPILRGDWVGPQGRAETLRAVAGSPAFVRFLSVLSLGRTGEVVEVDLAKLLDGATTRVVNTLNDPYSRYFAPEEFQDFHVSASGEYEVIGVEITID